MLTMLACTVLFILRVAALPSPYAHFASQAHIDDTSLIVDLGYGRYQGWYNKSAELVIFQGQVRSRPKFTWPGKYHENTLIRSTVYGMRRALQENSDGKLLGHPTRIWIRSYRPTLGRLSARRARARPAPTLL